jgi:predicted MFS family arabinose efflux permease
MFFTGVPLYLTAIFHANTKQIGWFYCFNGIGNVLSILAVQKYVLARISLKNIMIYACLLGALAILSLTILNSFNAISIAVLIFAMVELLAYSSLLAIYSNTVTPDEQGKAMGGTAALASLAFIITALLSAALATINAKAPLIGGAILFIICSLLISIRHQTKGT